MSGNGNHGLVQGATLGNDRYGNINMSYSFDGTDDWIGTPNNYQSQSSGTISFWFNPRSWNWARGVFSSRSEAWPNINGDIIFYDGETQSHFHVYAMTNYGSWAKTESQNPVQYGSWTQVIYTWGSAVGKKLYINGKFQSQSNNAEPVFSGLPVAIGRQRDLYFDGLIDEVRIYDRSLSIEEISKLYKIESPNHFVDLNSTVNLEMIWVEPGTFTMGSPESELGGVQSEHNVTLEKGFYLSKYEVTQSQYEAIMTGNDANLSATPSNWPNNSNLPVENISWEDVQIFLQRINEHQAGRLPPGWEYILPTETQWEYACRAGTNTAYSWGNDVNSTMANYDSNVGHTTDAGSYQANTWGFYDMHGNVFEFAVASQAQATLPTTDPSNISSFFNLLMSFDDNNYTPGQVYVEVALSGPSSIGYFVPAKNWGLKQWDASSSWQAGDRVIDTVSQAIYEMDSNVKGTFIGQATQSGDLVLYGGQWYQATGTNSSTDTPGVSGSWSWVNPLTNGATDVTNEYTDLTNTNIWSHIEYGSTVGKIIKGGGWNSSAIELESAERDSFSVDLQNSSIGFRLALQYTNNLPSDLHSKTSLTIAENQPAGTLVGEFNATDPDDGVITYSLVSGPGDGNNSLFTLDTNGTLRSKTIFDYEANASNYTIRVQARDEFNATIEGIFTITLHDVYEPSKPHNQR